MQKLSHDASPLSAVNGSKKSFTRLMPENNDMKAFVVKSKQRKQRSRPGPEFDEGKDVCFVVQSGMTDINMSAIWQRQMISSIRTCTEYHLTR